MDESKPKASSWIVKRLNDSPTGSIDGRGGVEVASKKNDNYRVRTCAGEAHEMT